MPKECSTSFKSSTCIRDAKDSPHRKQAVSVIKRGGEHLLSLIEGTMDIARIESGKLTLNVKPMRFADCVHEMAGMFESAKGTLNGVKPGQHTLELRVTTADHNTELKATDKVMFTTK